MKKLLSLLFYVSPFFIQYDAMASLNHIDIAYEHDSFKEVADSDIIKVTTKVMQEDSFLEAVYADLEYRKWDLENSRLDSEGTTGQVVGFYNLGNENQLLGSTQVQLASSNLFPKSTVYQEMSYRFGDKRNILFGVGVGYQDYYEDGTDTFYKLGPVYYFEGGAVGYKNGKYTGSKKTLNSFFGDYQLTDTIKITATYNFGDGYWDYRYDPNTESAMVKSSDLDVKIAYDVNNELGVFGTIGKTKIKNKRTDKDELNSNNLGLGITHHW